MLNATWLQTFITLASEGNFTRTAARLNMTQPGVSQHLKKLESEVGAELMQRIGKKVVLTDAGRAVRDMGLRRLTEEDALREQIGKDAPDVGPVSIGCSGSFATLLYPRLMPRIVAAPDLSVTLQAAPQTDVIERVTRGHLDIGIINQDPQNRQLAALKIGFEDLCLITAAALAPGPLSFNDLQAMGCIDHPDSATYAELLMQDNFPDFKGADSLRRRGFINQITQIPAPVAAGAGYAILPRSGVDSFSDPEKLYVVPLTRPVRQELWLIHRAGRQMPLRCRWVENEISTLAGQLTA